MVAFGKEGKESFFSPFGGRDIEFGSKETGTVGGGRRLGELF